MQSHHVTTTSPSNILGSSIHSFYHHQYQNQLDFNIEITPHSMMKSLHSLVLLLASLSLSYGFQRQNTLLRSSLTMLKMSSSSDFPSLDVSRFQTGERPEGTEDFIMQQTMLRVKDPVKSLEFYCDVLGFRLVMYLEFPQYGFNVYFVCPSNAADIPEGQAAQWEYCMNTPGTIELTWNYGSESEEGPVYNTGNADSTGTHDGQKIKGGFGHIGITVPDVYEACERFKKLGCTFHKTPNAGGMKGLAFIKDPDGYLVEVLPRGPLVAKPIDCEGIPAEGGDGYKDNSK
mmetsp:Transcript_14794/g.35764  ORF Transcript_14794/g.35764 Transcript_14794/m.35764 type:complete len:288 (+) Transcript_14794:1617-2480(+)